MKRLFAVLLTAMQIVGSIVVAQVATARPALAADVCATTSGKDGSPASLTGVTDAYFIPTTGTLSSGATTIQLSSATPDTSGGGASTAIATGDLLLIIQMQDGTFTYSNNATYGTGGSSGSAGLYEYVGVTAVSGTTVTIEGAGSGGGLINSYHEAVKTSSHGQEVYQIVRVPQYVSTTLSSGFRSAYWNGNTGGVAAIDVASTLNLGGASIYANANGFRGGGTSIASATSSGVLNNDYVDSATMNGTNPSTNPPGFGFKGEGIFGTPDYNFYYSDYTTPSTPAGATIAKATSGNGYPGGDMGMGAPGSAGGGGTDMDPVSNDQNTGGGGGGNGGAGGNGGYPWSPNYTGNTAQYSTNNPGQHTAGSYAVADSTHNPDIGGRGGAAVSTFEPVDISHAYMGGGGGAGVNNNGTAGSVGSSGGPGGGIVLMRVADTSGSAATIYAQGATGSAPQNDGGGGGGAGGTVIITSPGAFSGITVHADGAAGTTAYASASGAANQHGPGGGGGGGIVLTTSPVTATVSGGSPGTTTTSATTYGATAGASGYVNTSISASSVPGVASGAECYSSSGAGNATLYNGPLNYPESVYRGSDYTGSYDGVVSATNNNDFTAVGMPLADTSGNTGNLSSVAGAPLGGTFTYTTLPTINVPHEFYYKWSQNKKYHTITLAAQAPVLPGSWNVEICQDNGSRTAPACAAVTTNRCSKAADQNTWSVVSGTASNLDTAQFCYYSGNSSAAQTITYWTVYTPASATYTAFQRYDSVIHATDDQSTPATNATHTELYAGYIVLTKNTAVVSSGCPAGEKPTYANGVCPGGVLRYTIDYRSIVQGAGQGTQGAIASVFPIPSASKLVLTDDGTVSQVSSNTAANWAAFSSGLKEALYNNLGTNNTLCGDGANHCGDSLASSTFLYYTGNPAGSTGSSTFASSPAVTKFAVTIGGSSKQIYPPGYTGQSSQGTITFAVTVK